jgi:hypothetical protein
MRIIAFIIDPFTIRDILVHVVEIALGVLRVLLALVLVERTKELARHLAGGIVARLLRDQ